MDEVEDKSKIAFLLHLFECEMNNRAKLRIGRFQKNAKLPSPNTLDNYVWHQYIKLPTAEIRTELEICAFISRSKNVVLVGSPGTGKTHLAICIVVRRVSLVIGTKRKVSLLHQTLNLANGIVYSLILV